MRFCDNVTLQELVERFTDEEIAQQFSTTALVVQNLRREYRILRNRTHRLNERYFDVLDTPEKAYVLGFIAADGHVSANGKVAIIVVTESDGALLEAIRTAVGSTAPLHIRQPGKAAYQHSRPTMRLELCSQRLVAQLNSFGLYHDKSITAVYPTIPHQLESHFIRGYFDGNGTITETYFNIVGTPAMLQGIHDAVLRHTDGDLGLRPHSRSPYVQVLRGNGRTMAPALHWMYTDATMRLQRKYDKYLTYWVEVSRP